MTIKQYLYNLMKQIHEHRASADAQIKLAYARAYMHGEEALNKLRDRWIEAEIAKRYTDGAEKRITLNYVKDPANPKHIAELDAHELYVENCKGKVDTKMATLKAELEAALAGGI